jgi:hypothetical protein
VDITCRGDVLQPEVVAPPFSPLDYKQRAIPADGQVITDRTYDEIKAQRTSSRTTA